MNAPLIFKTRRELNDWRREASLAEDIGYAWVYWSGDKHYILHKNPEARLGRGIDIPEKTDGVYRLRPVRPKLATEWVPVSPSEPN